MTTRRFILECLLILAIAIVANLIMAAGYLWWHGLDWRWWWKLPP